MRNVLIASLLTFVLFACGCALSEGGLSIVCTDFPCYDFARHAAGDKADVSMLLKPGTEAHAYDPAPSDIIAIAQADLFVYIGGESDAWVDGILAGFGDEAPRTLRMMDCVGTRIGEDDEHLHGDGEAVEYDEHIWTSPTNAREMVEALGFALGEVDPSNAAAYSSNAASYADEIAEIGNEIGGIVETGLRRELVFADRFPFVYLTREYGLDYLAAFQSCTADTEPSAQTMTALIRRVIDDGIPVVYTIEMSTQSIAKTVAEETGAEILTMQSMQTISQADFDAGKTYASVMRENAEALRKGLN